ncbi:MAG: Bax inhibitor-1/YccA family protein [Deltaproteobacteria bacterium]|nr:Bax inhibitor-1/YccA family protein [Deltaproteobacteria bacterium]MBW2152797.1 Bax inhibitor-1/YccA family protein [Deltaproteobacteria bacterium]
MESITTTRRTEAQALVNEFVRSVYNWMAIGLALTGFVAFYVASNESLLKLIYGNRLLFFGLIIAELALVFSISARVNKMHASTATALFILYAALNGATLSLIFIIYTRSTITSTFFVCAATFVACSVYGWTTKRDLTSFGGFLFMGLIGIIIASFVNMFVRSSGMNMIISYIGVLVFVGLTAYDTQKLKTMALTQPAGLEAGVIRKGAILGALSLYLDFINLFLMLLRILGNRD